MEYFIVVLCIFIPLINFVSNVLRNKKNQSFIFLITICAIFQLVLGPFNMLGFSNYFAYSVLTYILFIFGIISCFIYTFFPFLKFKKNKNFLLIFKKNFSISFIKSFLIPWVILIIISIFSLFFQSHFWDSTAYKLVSLNFRDGLYQFGGLGNIVSDGSYFTYKTSAGYYVSSVLATENIAFMYNYVWVIIFYTFFIFFVWDFFGEFISDKNDKKTIISRTILLVSATILIFLHHYVISAGNVVYASVSTLLAIYWIKKNNFLNFFLSILFIEFFTITGNLLVLPFVLGYFVYVLIFKQIKDLINFILLFAVSMVGSLSLFLKPDVNVANARMIIFSLYLAISILFFICYFFFNLLKINQNFLSKKIINIRTNFYIKKNFIICSVFFWLITVILFLMVFYISQYDKAYNEVPFIWCITGLGMAAIYYSIYVYFYCKKISLSKIYVYQLIQSCASIIFLLIFYLVGNAYQVGILKYLQGLWNSSTWRLLMTIPGIDFPYAIFVLYVINLFYLFKKFNFESWKSFFKKLHFKNKKTNNLNKINRNLIISGLTFSIAGSTIALSVYESTTNNDSTVITTNVGYLNDFNEQQKETLIEINNEIKDKTPYSENIILADTPVFEYIRCAKDFLGYNYNYTNFGEAMDKLDSTKYNSLDLWCKFLNGNKNIDPNSEKTLNAFLSLGNFNFKMIILDKNTSYYNTFKDKINSMTNPDFDSSNSSWHFYDNNQWYGIWSYDILIGF